MSTRAATTLREDIEVLGPVRVREVGKAQQNIVDVIRTLEENGQIVISRGGKEERSSSMRGARLAWVASSKARSFGSSAISSTSRRSPTPAAEPTCVRRLRVAGRVRLSGDDAAARRAARAAPADPAIDVEAIRAQARGAHRRRRRATPKRCSPTRTTRARALVEDAAARADAIAQDARKRGHDEGFAAGRDAADREMNDMLATMRGLLEMARVERHKLMEDAEPELVRLALGIAERVLHQQIALDRGVVVEMAKIAIARLIERDSVTVRVNPADLERMREHRDELIAIGDIRNLRVVEDQRVDRGGVVVETDAGTIDARISHAGQRGAQILHIEDDVIVEPAPASSFARKRAKFRRRERRWRHWRRARSTRRDTSTNPATADLLRTNGKVSQVIGTVIESNGPPMAIGETASITYRRTARAGAGRSGRLPRRQSAADAARRARRASPPAPTSSRSASRCRSGSPTDCSGACSTVSAARSTGSARSSKRAAPKSPASRRARCTAAASPNRSAWACARSTAC